MVENGHTLDFHFITIFPDMFEAPLASGILGIAARKGTARYHIVNLRDFAVDSYGSVDDYPYGGGAGMVFMVPPIMEAVESIRPEDAGDDTRVILLSPCGAVFTQAKALELARRRRIIFICGRYKGVDERVRELVVDEAISIGDYIVSGGEFPALVVTESVVRTLPGVLGDERSRETDSFSRERGCALDAAYYTRPLEYRGLRVPETLVSGNHAKIADWRSVSARERTLRYRPDLAPGPD